MERREQYDPEDIEQLLLERRFDDLLEEERAYVLRHLAGRAEYDAMRTLLLTVRQDEGEHAEMNAAPEIREHVLDVFRSQQKPQWTIWLNSVKAFLLPKDVSAFWKPALAFTSLAAIIGVCLIGFRSLNEKAPEVLADLKQVKEEPAKPLAPTADDRSATSATTDGKNTEAPAFGSSLDREKSTDGPVTTEQQPVADDASGPRTDNNGLTASPSATKAAAGAVATVVEDKHTTIETVHATGTTTAANADSTTPAREEATYDVTKKDLAANYTLTNAASSGFYKATEAMRKTELDALAEHARDKDEKKNEEVANDAQFVDLLRAAW